MEPRKGPSQIWLLVGMLFSFLLIFVGLKLSHLVQWSWKWVFAPVWVPPIFVGLVMVGQKLVIMLEKVDNT